MPILDVEVVTRDVPVSVDTGARAPALGAALDSVPGSVWVRVRHLAAADYAENGDQPDPLPVFVRVIARSGDTGRWPQHARVIAAEVATAVRRPRERVHVIFEPDARGRVFFGDAPDSR
jgi:hypothetical protein